MEELLPFLAGLTYMGYKIFTNYQQGQEEAKKRNPSIPVQERSLTPSQEWGDFGDTTYRPSEQPERESATAEYEDRRSELEPESMVEKYKEYRKQEKINNERISQEQKYKDEKYQAEKYHEPVYEPFYNESGTEKRYKKLTDKKIATAIPTAIELYNPEVPAEEVIRGREIHAPHKHKFVASQREEIRTSDFDFEDAIIKEAILNRPEY